MEFITENNNLVNDVIFKNWSVEKLREFCKKNNIKISFDSKKNDILEIIIRARKRKEKKERKWKEIEFRKRLLIIENLIQEKKFSSAIIELNALINRAKSINFKDILNIANDKLISCKSLGLKVKNGEMKNQIATIEELIQEEQYSNAIKELINVIEEASLYDLDGIINKANEMINSCENLEAKKIERLIQENDFSSAINELNALIEVVKFRNLKGILNMNNAFEKLNSCKKLEIEFKAKKTIKKTVLDLGTKFGRLQISEISEVSPVKDDQLIIDVIKEMIENKEIHAQYFESSKSIAFNQQANVEEIDKLMATYKEWEEKKVGKK